MLTAVKGIIQGNTVIIEDDIRKFDGAEVVVTVLNYPGRETEDLNKTNPVSFNKAGKKASEIEKALQSLLGAVPYTDMTLAELREERLQKYENTD